MGPGAIKRRKFLGFGVAATAGGTLAGCTRSGGGPYWRFFTPGEARTVEAVCEQIIPRDDYPGATDAGVVNFIDIQLAGHYRRHQGAYRKGIAALDETSRARHGKTFSELPSETQMQLLEEEEGNKSNFFDLVKAHTMQGFYGDPRHGGNRGMVSWKMLGLCATPVRGRLPFKKQGE
jgi:gluconate 2-dehydrogenase gamma chain